MTHIITHHVQGGNGGLKGNTEDCVRLYENEGGYGGVREPVGDYRS